MSGPAFIAATPVTAFPERLLAFRVALQMTHTDLARAVGATVAAVRRWEVGTARPSAEQAVGLAHLGMADIGDADTNQLSIARLNDSSPLSRAEQARSHREAGRRPFGFADEVWEIVPAPCVLNGPPDQVLFHETLLRMQMEPVIPPSITPDRYPSRLSLVADVDGQPTSQARLERSRSTATFWNSNYGSHGWHRYVGRFPPHLVRALLNHFQAKPGDVVLDPFTGSGTTNVECRLLGVPSVGVEISPLSALVARTKSAYPESSVPLRELSTTLTDFYCRRWSAFVDLHKGLIPDHATVLTRPGNLVPEFPNYEKWLTPEALLGISLVVEIAAELHGPMREFLLVALSSKMRSIGNVDVDVVRAEYRREPRADVDVLRLVSTQLKKMANSVDAMADSHPGSATATDTQIIGGSVLDAQFEEGSIAHVITSPPYGVESLSYLRTHLLSFRCLEPFLHTDPYATGTGVIGSEYLDPRESGVPRYEHAAASAAFNEFFSRNHYEDDPKLARRAPMMMRFFDDMGLLVDRLGAWIRPGGCVAFVIGNKRLGEHVIPAHQIISELFAAKGFEIHEPLEHKLKTNNSNSQVPWQERIIQNEYVLIMSRS